MNPNKDNHPIDQYMKSLDDQCQPAFQANHWDQLDQMLNSLPPTSSTHGERQQDKGAISPSPSFPKGIIISSVVVIMGASFIWYTGKSVGSPHLNSLGTFIHLNEDTSDQATNQKIQNSTVIDLSDIKPESQGETSAQTQDMTFNSASDKSGQTETTNNSQSNQLISSDAHREKEVSSISGHPTGQKEPLTIPVDTLSSNRNETDSIPSGKKKKFLFW